MRFAFLALLLAASPAIADSFTSSASSAASQSVGSVSDSISGSSESSSGKGEAKFAAGEYRIVAIAPAGERVSLRLAPLASEGQAQAQAQLAPSFALHLPAGVAQAQSLQAGQSLHLLARNYGWAVARDAAAAPFFLLLEDASRRELDSVKL